jgi:multicomponent Na+:H+ antiporter subunit A
VIWALLIAHLAGCGLLAAVGDRLGRRGLLVAALPPAATLAWAASEIGEPEPATARLTWVDGLDLELAFGVDAFAGLMTLLVSGIGVLVFVYAFGYFSPGTDGLGRFATTLLAFATSMLGLVWSDSVWTLFIFWELTSVTSFLLVGHKSTDEAVLLAARRALLITGGGGLTLLAGLLVLADASGTTLLSELSPAGGVEATTAAVLIMVGAATKSAQVPFHVWLPGAMAAPTPVSAYLHSATMVKAGVVLVAVAGPAFTEVGVWKAAGLSFGIVSIAWGAVGALRHRDAKLILAWGTVSQLGLLITLLSVGTAKATFAAISLLVAHALFKAALFLVVGEIDVRAGTRHVDELGGLARSMPVAFAVALAAGLSMAGVPPLLGFAAKEAAVEATLGLEGTDALLVGVGVIGGSVLTVAYTARFLIAVFGPGPATALGPPRPAMTVPAMALGAAGVVGYGALGVVDGIVGPAATRLDDKAEVYELLRWPGLTAALGVSAAVVATGAALGWALTRRLAPVPASVGAQTTDAALDGVITMGRLVCRRVQHGSLPVYVATMATMATAATTPFLAGLGTDHLVAWDSPLQAVLAVTIVGAALAVATVENRIGAGLALGVVGIGVSALFVMHGAPDLVLTQLLVETVIVVGFVIGFSQLSRRFPPVGARWRAVRLSVAGLGGAAVMVGLAAAGANQVGEPPVAALAEVSVDEGGGKNVVNVILTDIRALDTLGEAVVLATVAVGILALARAGARRLEAAP